MHSRRHVLTVLIAAASAIGPASHAASPLGWLGGASRDRKTEPAFPDIAYADWTEAEPPYRVYPGDELEISVLSAPELSKTLVIQPDGRILLPLAGPLMAADRTLQELETQVTRAYAAQLLRPRVTVAVRTAQPLKVFVGGEVERPGVYDMPGDINALQAIIQAGGFRISAQPAHVTILRRGPDGRAMKRTVDLKTGLRRSGADLVPLRRFDIIFVPRNAGSEAGRLIQQYFRDLIPVSLGFSYALNNSSNR
jgi:polysaccharide export outer membrane protein